MRVYNVLSFTRAAWWAGAWLTTTAIRPQVQLGLMSSAKNINEALMSFIPPHRLLTKLGPVVG